MAYVKCIRNLISSTVPDGKTVTPTDDISIWLACGGRSETYTTLSQVLADSTCLNALINDNNAVDYLVRSTTWASDVCGDSGAMTAIGGKNYAANTLLADSTWCSAICNSAYFESVLNVKVPIMTSNTTPAGECFGSSVNSSTYDYYKAFDGDNSTFWAPSTGNMPQTIGYKSTSAICVKSLKIYPYIYNGTTPSIATFQLQGSNDNNTWVDIGNVKTIDSVGEKEFTFDSNSTSYLYHQIKVLSKNVSGGCNINSLQFYGRADI